MRESVRREGSRGWWWRGLRSCDIAAAARLRISVFSVRERERASKEGRDRQRVWCVALLDKL